MATQSNSAQTGIRARQVPQSIRFLRKLGVPATRLAGIFGNTADNIRHIDNRSYKEERTEVPLSTLTNDDLSLLRLSLKDRQEQVRRNLQGLRLRSKRDLDQVEDTVWAIFKSHQSVGLEEGYDALLAMLPGVANARHGQAIRILLLIEEKLAWFALPLDRIDAALSHALAAMTLAVDAFKESAGVKGYLLRYSEAALVASICLQKLHRPERALAFIQAADEANIAAGELPGSEHFRQRGTSFMHMGAAFDDLANTQFTRAPKQMLRKQEARHEIDVAMNGLRQRAFLHPAWGWEKAFELASDVKMVYGDTSMQYVVAAKSAALVGLKFGTTEATATSLKLLREISVANAESDVPHILSITPELKLSPEQVDLWLRFAMSETPLPPRK